MPAASVAEIVSNARALEAKGVKPERIRQYVQTAKAELGSNAQPAAAAEPKVKAPVGAVAMEAARQTIPVLPGVVDLIRNPGNIISSASENASSVIKAVSHPIDNIVKPIASVAKGGAQKLMRNAVTLDPTPGPDEAAFDALKNMFKERYGSVAKLNETVEKDPVGFAGDVSAALGLGGGTVKAVAKVGGLENTLIKIPKIGAITVGEAGKAASAASSMTDPLLAAGRAAAGTVKAAGKGVSVVGKTAFSLATGKPTAVIAEAMKNPTPEFFAYLRDQKPTRELVDSVSESLDQVAQKEHGAYQKELSKISKIKGDLDITPVKKSVDAKLKDFRVKRTGLQQEIKTGQDTIYLDNGLDFSNSPLQLDAEAQATIARVVAKVESMGKRVDDLKPGSVDAAKKALSSLYSENSDARAFVGSVKGSVSDVLKTVPGYTKMTKRYQQFADFMDEFKATLGDPNQANADAALSKLSKAMAENADLKRDLLKKFEDITGKELKPALAGQQMSNWRPPTLQAVMGAGSGLAYGGMGMLLNPGFLLSISLSSPRVAGEFLGHLGLGKQKSAQILDALAKSRAGKAAAPVVRATGKLAPTAAKAVFQGGRASELLGSKDER